jgi:hypothetical protein
MILEKIEDLDEENGEVLLLKIIAFDEPPYSRGGHYLDYDFDPEEWTHFVEVDWNKLLGQV